MKVYYNYNVTYKTNGYLKGKTQMTDELLESLFEEVLELMDNGFTLKRAIEIVTK